MKKFIITLVLVSSILLFSACSQKEEGRKDAIFDMVNLKKDMQQNIQNSVDQENEKINNAMGEDVSSNNLKSPATQPDLTSQFSAALIKTSLGDIKVKFYAKDAPKTVNNFLYLAQAGFYNGTKFHRVIKGFMIQGGDPLSKDDTMKDKWGTGGPGYKFNDELKGTEKYPQGTLAMANSGPNTNGSQFFIVTASPEASLPASYTVFGQVVSGLDVALKIENAKTGTSDRPVEDVIIKNIEPLGK